MPRHVSNEKLLDDSIRKLIQTVVKNAHDGMADEETGAVDLLKKAKVCEVLVKIRGALQNQKSKEISEGDLTFAELERKVSIDVGGSFKDDDPYDDLKIEGDE